MSNLLYCIHDLTPYIGGSFKHICIMLLGNDERVSRIDGHDVEEGQCVSVFVDFLTRDFTRNDFAKEAVCVFHMRIV